MPTEAAVPAPGDLSCRDMIALVTEYLEGTMPRQLRARFEAHLDACIGCQAYLDQMRQSLALLGRLNERTVPPESLERLVEAFRDWKRATRRRN